MNNNRSENRILSSVSPEIFAALKPHLSVRELISGEILGEVGASVEAFFPLSGIISLVVELSIGQMVETAMVGRDGVVNASAASLGKAKVLGLIIDRREVGEVGAFTSMTDEELLEEAKRRAEALSLPPPKLN